MKNLFVVLKKKRNFTVDPAKGKLVLFMRRVELNEIMENEVEINLKLSTEEERKEEGIEKKDLNEFF